VAEPTFSYVVDLDFRSLVLGSHHEEEEEGEANKKGGGSRKNSRSGFTATEEGLCFTPVAGKFEPMGGGSDISDNVNVNDSGIKDVVGDVRGGDYDNDANSVHSLDGRDEMRKRKRVVVVGAGPAGLFAALTVAEAAPYCEVSLFKNSVEWLLRCHQFIVIIIVIINCHTQPHLSVFFNTHHRPQPQLNR
jgi:hypothetical protein